MLPEVDGTEQLYKRFLQDAQELPKWVPNDTWITSDGRRTYFIKLIFFHLPKEHKKELSES